MNKQSDRQRALSIIGNLGGEWFEYGGMKELIGSVYSPAGYIWIATGCHVISVSYLSDRRAGWKALLDDVVLGVKTCDNPECEYCEDEGE